MLIEIFTKNFWVAFSFFLAKTDLLHLLWITMMSWNFDRLFAKDSSKYPFSPFQHWYFCNLNYSEFRFIASIWKKVHVCVDIFHKRNGIWCFVVVFKENELLSKDTESTYITRVVLVVLVNNKILHRNTICNADE